MKILLLITVLFISTSFPQLDDYPRANEGVLTGGFGLNWIDGDLHYSFHFMPEVSFLNFGFGLDLRLDFNSSGELRKENYNEFSDYLSIIRYARYGLKREPVFIKAGSIDYYTLGHGSIMYQYNNSPGFDVRQTGIVVDIDFGSFGFESIYGSLAQAGVFGFRGFVRPLHFTQLASIPIINNIEIGATYAADFHDKAGIISATLNNITNEIEVYEDEKSINIIGVDIGLPVLRSDFVGIDLYADYAKIINFGQGAAAGINFNFGGLGLIRATAKLERRFNGRNYIPSYFNSLHEVQRFNFQQTATAYSLIHSKAQMLAFADEPDNGYYGQLGVSVLNLFQILGSYQRLDKTPNSGILHLSSEISSGEMPFLLRFGYDKVNIGAESDLFKLDDRSFLFMEAGYKPMPYLLISMVYSWTYTPLRNNDDLITGYEPIKRIEPRITFIFPFDVPN
jgi:hypothetical protein